MQSCNMLRPIEHQNYGACIYCATDILIALNGLCRTGQMINLSLEVLKFQIDAFTNT